MKSEPIKPYNYWEDPSAPNQQFDHPEFLKRLQEVHGIDPKKTTGTRSMLAHIDGDTWFSWDYAWEIGGKKFTQHTRNLRTGQNLANWSGQ